MVPFQHVETKPSALIVGFPISRKIALLQRLAKRPNGGGVIRLVRLVAIIRSDLVVLEAQLTAFKCDNPLPNEALTEVDRALGEVSHAKELVSRLEAHIGLATDL